MKYPRLHRKRAMLALAMVAGLATSSPALFAQQILDAAGDWAPTYTGPKNGDLDVLSSQVFFDPNTSRFAFTATFAGPVTLTPGTFYVWGINRGGPQGAPPFGANGAPAVVFDATVVLRPGIGVTAGGGAVSDFFHWQGNTITAVVPMSFLGLTQGGFATRNEFTWNLWPRAAGQQGNNAISDFAPDNAMAAMTVGTIPAAILATPEPASFVLVGAGLFGMFAASKRRRVS